MTDEPTRCPHCGKELKILPRAYSNVDHYKNTCLTRTECCGHAVRVIPRMRYEILPYHGKETHDDWGSPFKPTKY